MPELIQQVSSRHQANELVLFDDDQRSDGMPTHQVRRLAQCRGWADAHGPPSRHQVTNGSSPPRFRHFSPAEIAFGDDPHDVAAIDYDQMPDAVLPHSGQRGFGRLFRTDRDYSSAHDVSKTHAVCSCKRRAESVDAFAGTGVPAILREQYTCEASASPESEEAAAAACSRWLVVGARGASGVHRLLLGSVAEGALNYSPVPVLVVR
jgi:hypothetical protein